MSTNRLQLAGVVFVAFMLLLTACAGAGNSGGENAATPSSKETSTSSSAGSAEPKTRSFQTVKGAVEIPVHPQRIVTDYYAGELLAVGANVVGAVSTAFDNPFLKDLLKRAEDVGDPINVEKVLELNPDLIIVMYDKNYDALSKIAPTLHIPYGTASDIYETLTLFGDIVGQPEQAEQFIAEYEKKAAEGREKLKDVIDETATFGLYELTDKGELWMFGDNAGRGGQAIYNALKLKMPEKMANTGEQVFQLSMEVLPEYAADYMFLTVYDPENRGEALKQLQNSPIWRDLKAVKSNRLFINDFNTFYPYDPISITKQIDLFVEMIVERSKGNEK